MTTAAQAHWGGIVVASPTSTYRLRLPYGENGARFFDLNPSAGQKLLLPNATLCRTGGPLFTIYNRSGNTMDVRDRADTVSIATLAANSVTEFWLIANTTVAGTWLTSTHGTVLEGGLIPINRENFTIDFTANALSVSIFRHLIQIMGWNRVNPVAVRVNVHPGVIIGSQSNQTPGLVIDFLPSGSIVWLHVMDGAYIVGKGGDGARGTTGAAAIVGEGGGTALRLGVDTFLVNQGVIGGGGGGGGAGDGGTPTPTIGAISGGGGGGGAGYFAGLGGLAGTGGFAGGNASLTQAGANGTGFNDGGPGGVQGVAGNAAPVAGSAGGPAGNAIETRTGTTLTKIVAGTINGPEVTI